MYAQIFVQAVNNIIFSSQTQVWASKPKKMSLKQQFKHQKTIATNIEKQS